MRCILKEVDFKMVHQRFMPLFMILEVTGSLENGQTQGNVAQSI